MDKQIQDIFTKHNIEILAQGKMEKSFLRNDADAVYYTKLRLMNTYRAHIFHDDSPIGIYKAVDSQLLRPLNTDHHPLGVINVNHIYKMLDTVQMLKTDLERYMSKNVKLDVSLFEEEWKEFKKAQKEIRADSKYDTRFSNGWRYADYDSWMNFVEGGSIEVYTAIANKCKNHGITCVYDIGCNCAWQAKIFQQAGIKYIGIEVERESLRIAPQGEGIEYIPAKYPVEIQVKDKNHTAAISSLCIGYEADGNEVYERMAKDFRFFCGKPGPGGYAKFSELYGVVEKDFVLFCDTERVKKRSVAVFDSGIESENTLWTVDHKIISNGKTEKSRNEFCTADEGIEYLRRQMRSDIKRYGVDKTKAINIEKKFNESLMSEFFVPKYELSGVFEGENVYVSAVLGRERVMKNYLVQKNKKTISLSPYDNSKNNKMKKSMEIGRR